MVISKRDVPNDSKNVIAQVPYRGWNFIHISCCPRFPDCYYLYLVTLDQVQKVENHQSDEASTRSPCYLSAVRGFGQLDCPARCMIFRSDGDVFRLSETVWLTTSWDDSDSGTF